MTEIYKKGAAIQEGFEYQYWYGVKLIIDWKVAPPNDLNNSPWLKEEIGRDEYGIFDDILMFKDSEYFFYQAKKSYNTMGGLISEVDLLEDNSKLSISKMYSSYKKIKRKYPDKIFYLINISNKQISGILRDVIIPNENRFEDSFVDSTVRKSEKIKFRDEINKKCKNADIRDFLKSLRFIFYENPKSEISLEPILPYEVIQYIYNWVKKIAQKQFRNSENKISYKDFTWLLNINDLDIPLRIGIYSKSEFPIDVLYDYSIDFFSQINVKLTEIDWERFREEIESIRRVIINQTQNRLIRIEALTHLTLGYIIGFVFRSTTGFKLQVRQQFKDLEEIWEYKSKNNEDIVNLEINEKKSNKNTAELILCLEFTNKPVNSFVQKYLNENDIKGYEFIEIISTEPIQANQITNIIDIILNQIVKFKWIKIIHIFSAIPLGLAILLGYNFNALPTIQLYEFDMVDRKYFPSYKLKQKKER